MPPAVAVHARSPAVAVQKIRTVKLHAISRTPPRIAERIETQIQSHVELEKKPDPGISIAEYSEPTAISFKLIFEGFGRLCESKGGNGIGFGDIGSEIGRSIKQKSQGGYISDGTQVKVIGDEAFGIVVEPCEEQPEDDAQSTDSFRE